MTIEEYEALMELVRMERAGMMRPEGKALTVKTPEPKPKKKKRSKYNRELSKQLKMLKQKHPRTPITRLMKKAHRATKKALK